MTDANPRPRVLNTAHGELRLPAFLPDATRGVIRTLDAADAAECGVEALMVNVLHLSSHPGTSIAQSLGGIHRFMGWPGPVASDSGGFQILSLIEESRLGSVTARGLTYRLARGEKRRTLTPEKCIQRQFQLGTDIMFCLDHCTHPQHPSDRQRESVEHTIEWARRCKDEFVRRCDRMPDDAVRPRLLAVVQGGADRDLRERCAAALGEIGFDGYGYGGWPIGDGGRLVDMVGLVAELVPEGSTLHALGVGKPENVVSAFELGYDLFDCTIPTRDARHMRLYVSESPEGVGYDNLYMGDDKHVRDARSVDPSCDCRCCRSTSRAYLHHLFAIRDPLAARLATIHNLRFYSALMERLRARTASP